MITALSGTSRLRNTAISSRKLRNSTAPMNHGRRDDMRSDTSMLAAVSPPTFTAMPLPCIAFGITSLRSVWTRSSVAADCGAVVGDDPDHRGVARRAE